MNTFKIRRQGNQLHVYVTVDGTMIAHRVFSIPRIGGNVPFVKYILGLRSWDLTREA